MDLIEQARAAIQAGDKTAARQLLQQAVRQQPQNYVGWLWLASVAASPTASLNYVARAERLNPTDPTVQKAKAWAERRLAKSQTKVMATPPASQRWQGWRVASLIVLLLLLGAVGYFYWEGMSTQTAVLPTAIPTSQPLDAANNIIDNDLNEKSAVAIPKQQPTPTPEPTQRVERVLAKNGVDSANPRAKWTATPLPTNTPIPTPTLAPTFVAETTAWVGKRPFGVGENERWIDVNLSTQTLNAFEGDELVFTSLISSGLAAYPTVTGQFRTWLKYESQTMDGRRLGYDYYLENVPYVMYFFEDYAIHGAYWHNNFGTPMSHGCVNMNIADSQWLFNWAGLGTLVNVHY